MKEIIAKYQDNFELFLEAGFIAVNQMDEPAATSLFKAADLLKPADNVLPEIGRGYLQLHLLNLKEAAKCFEKVLKKEPDNLMAKTFLGITLSWMPKEIVKGEKILKETEKSSDKTTKKLSHTALNFNDKFIKKEVSPAEIQKAKSKANIKKKPTKNKR